MKTTVHIIPHAHWDREWYLPLEIHRARLISQLDSVLELLEADPSYTYHLDGQMIAVEDYLLLRPDREEQIRKFVREGRLHIGPWYVLQDEYLTSGEANVRNLLYGMAMAERFGNICRIGYLPDAFGNVGQMPQLFSQAGMKAAAFGRGVTLKDEDPDPAGHFPVYSEFTWQSPDGSTVQAIFFPAGTITLRKYLQIRKKPEAIGMIGWHMRADSLLPDIFFFSTAETISPFRKTSRTLWKLPGIFTRISNSSVLILKNTQNLS